MTRLSGLHAAVVAGFISITTLANPMVVGPASAQSQSVSDIRVDFGPIAIRIPRIEASGSSLTSDEIKGLFDPSVSEPLSQRLSRLNATSIVIPELILEQIIGPTKTITIYRDMVVRDIKNGRAADMVVANSVFRNDAKGQESGSGTMGRMTISNVDLALTAKIYGEVAGPDDKDFKTMYSSFVSEGMTMKLDKGAEFTIARMSGKEAKARPSATPLMGIMRQLSTIKPDAKPADAEAFKMALGLFDVFDNFTLGDAEMTGMAIRDTSGKDGPMSANIARMSLRLSETSGGEARMEGFSVDAKDTRIRIGTMAFSDFSFKPTIAALRSMLSNPAAKPDAFDPRAFIPALGTITLSGIDIDAPDPSAKGKSDRPAQRMKVRLRHSEIKAANQLNGIPTSLRFGVEGLGFDIPADTKESGLKSVLALGYKAVDLSWGFNAAWKEASKEIEINNLNIGGVDMGRFDARATLGNATKELFSPDIAMQQIAALSTTAKALTISLDNKGLVERLLAQQAKQSGKTADDLRREYSAMATLMIPTMLGPSSGAKEIGVAIAQFIAKPNRLMISAKTKDAAGLGAADLATIGAPAALLEKLDVTAKAE
jgi:hypothetical protein